MKETSFSKEAFNSLGTILSILLPLSQFLFIDLPDNISGLFLNHQIFYYVSVLTILSCIFVIIGYLSNPNFKFVFSKKHQREYFRYLSRPKIDSTDVNNSVDPPYEITYKVISCIAITLFILTSLIFLWLGVRYSTSNQISANLTVGQSLSYILMFTTSTFLLFHFSYTSYRQSMFKENERMRIQKTINNAIENNCFPEFPRIQYIESCFDFKTMEFNLVVKVGEEKSYLIKTDHNEIVKSITPFNN